MVDVPHALALNFNAAFKIVQETKYNWRICYNARINNWIVYLDRERNKKKYYDIQVNNWFYMEEANTVVKKVYVA